MTTSQIVWGVVAAALVFWIVGAYNRLVQLRGAIVRAFPPVDEQFTGRHALLLQVLDVIAPALPDAAPRIDVLRAACQQLEAACGHARQRPGAVGAITSLRLADDILGEARARLPVQSMPGTNLGELNAQLTAADAALAFARGRFNEAVRDYNAAVRQFPTLLIVGLFGFRGAGTL